MVLFVLGLAGVLLVNATKLSKQLRENVGITVFMKTDQNVDAAKDLQTVLLKNPSVISTKLITKEEAAANFVKDYGEEFTDLLGANPLPHAINLRLESAYIQTDSLEKLQKRLMAYDSVEEVNYPSFLVKNINQNLKKWSLFLLVLSAIFLFIAITLIDNTIKLSMYSDRFLIKSMQLVGATRSFITRPFVSQSVINGVTSGILACVLLFALLYFVDKNLNLISLRQNLLPYLYIGLSVIFIGVLISFWSTKAAVVKYLKLKLDELY